MLPFLWRELGELPIIGVDEVGRGCLAGDVYAAAVILDPSFDDSQITDSKLLSATRREIISEQIKLHSRHCIGIASLEEIAELNILQATFLAMRRAIEGLGVASGMVLVDGNQLIPKLAGFKQIALVKGDLRASPIGAASILAKVARDQYMKDLAFEYPDYGFEKHKGYASAEHRHAIQIKGPSPMHRRTFGGVREYWPPEGFDNSSRTE